MTGGERSGGLSAGPGREPWGHKRKSSSKNQAPSWERKGWVWARRRLAHLSATTAPSAEGLSKGHCYQENRRRGGGSCTFPPVRPKGKAVRRGTTGATEATSQQKARGGREPAAETGRGEPVKAEDLALLRCPEKRTHLEVTKGLSGAGP